MFRDRTLALLQIAVVWIICWLAYVHGPALAPTPATADVTARLVFAIEWLIVPAVLLLACTLVTMTNRLWTTKEALYGTRTPDSQFLEINLRVTQNTLEQSFLAVIAWCGLAVTLPADRLGIVPVLSVLFAAGRILFWVGYQWHPIARALGFGITAVPTAIAILWLAWRLLTG